VAMPSSTNPRRVTILVYDGVTLLDVAGPAEAFQTANRFGADYQIVLVSPRGETVTSNLGFGVCVDRAVSAEPAPDTYLVPGADRYPRAPVPRDLAEAARVPAGGARRIASICTGAFILAAAGLLDGKRATTHWKVAGELATRCPTCRVEPDAIYVRDGSTYTSAGVTSGIDLALALVEEDHGPDLTREVARAREMFDETKAMLVDQLGAWQVYAAQLSRLLATPPAAPKPDSPPEPPRVLNPDQSAARVTGEGIDPETELRDKMVNRFELSPEKADAILAGKLDNLPTSELLDNLTDGMIRDSTGVT